MDGKRREIQMLYSHDRLGDEKISQIYGMLVPEKRWKIGDAHEDGSALCPSILRETKGGADDREPDGSSQGVCKNQWLYGIAGVDIPGRRL
jgi:hypothetical protein